MSADVDIDHVTIRFGGFTAVKSVNMKIEGGEFFSILGPSGCGKTTLLRAISGFSEPTEGAVRIGGKDMAGIGSRALSDDVARPPSRRERPGARRPARRRFFAGRRHRARRSGEMSNAWTAAAVFLGPLVIVLGFVLAALSARQRQGVSAGRGFFARNGAPVAIFLIVAVGFWMLFLIVYPQLYMFDYSFHPKLPPAKRGGPDDIYTLENYRYFLYGSTRDFSHWNVTHLHAFWITIFVLMIITIVNFAVCYPLAY